MKEIDSNCYDLLLLNKEDREDSGIQWSKSSDNKNFDDYFNASAPRESDIQSFIWRIAIKITIFI